MGIKRDKSPAALTYVEAILARAAALGFPPVLLCAPGKRSSNTDPAFVARVAVANAVKRAGLSPLLFKDVAATSAAADRFRRLAYERSVVTPQVERVIAQLTAGLPPYVPAAEVVPPAPHAVERQDPLRISATDGGGRFHHLPPWAFEDDPAAITADAAGPRFTPPPTWVHSDD